MGLFCYNLFGHLLGTKSMLFTHCSNDGNQNVLTIIEQTLNLITKLTLGKLDVALGITRVSDQGQESILNINELVLLAENIGNIHVVGGGGDIFVLLTSEDVNTDQVDLGVTVLASLGGAHVDDLAGTARDDDESVLAEGRALHGEELGGSRGSLLESLIFFVSHRSINFFVDQGTPFNLNPCTLYSTFLQNILQIIGYGSRTCLHGCPLAFHRMRKIHQTVCSIGHILCTDYPCFQSVTVLYKPGNIALRVLC
jgi:hypothetical protein